MLPLHLIFLVYRLLIFALNLHLYLLLLLQFLALVILIVLNLLKHQHFFPLQIIFWRQSRSSVLNYSFIASILTYLFLLFNYFEFFCVWIYTLRILNFLNKNFLNLAKFLCLLFISSFLRLINTLLLVL